jgi:hypothetical protein
MINLKEFNTEQYVEYLKEIENGKVEDFEDVPRCENAREKESHR